VYVQRIASTSYQPGKLESLLANFVTRDFTLILTSSCIAHFWKI